MKKIFAFSLIFQLSCVAFSQVSIQSLDSGILFLEKDRRILFYRTVADEQQGSYKRSNYVHPLYSLDGAILTEDYPQDHPHHHGIFWAWHQLYIGDTRIGDGWVNKDLSFNVISVDLSSQSGLSKRIETTVEWLSPLWVDNNGNIKPVVTESTTITVYPANRNYRKVDFVISIIATQPDTRIGGSEDPKGYGGFSSRIRLPDDITFTGYEGQVSPETYPVEAIGWLDLSGSLGKNGTQAGITILSHPENPGYPNPWILRSKRSMQNAVYPYPGATPVALSDKEATTLRYRLIIHGEQVPDLANLHGIYTRQ